MFNNTVILINIPFSFHNDRYSTELLEKVREMAEGIEVEDAPVFKTRDEIMKKQQVNLWTCTDRHTCHQYVDKYIISFIPLFP